MTIITVIVMHAGEALPFVFTDEREANEFARHVRDLYGKQATPLMHGIDTYDSAIEGLVEAIGPSPD